MFNALHKAARFLLPTWAYARLIGDWNAEGFRKYFFNTGWIFAARVISFAVSFFTIAFVAQYLGPENFGKLSYAQSFVAIFSVFASFGIDQVIFRELIKHPERETELLGTTIAAKCIFGCIALTATVAVAILANEEPILSALIFIIALSFIFQPLGILAHFFNAHVKAKYNSYIIILLAFLIPALKLLIIYFGQGILYFAALLVFESLILAAFYLAVYMLRFRGSPFSWKFSFPMLTRLLSDSWPLMLASFSGYIYGRIDQVMIQHFIDSASVGLYDAAVRVTEILSFLPIIFMSSLFPAIVNAQRQSVAEYKKRLRALASFCLGFSTFCVLCIYIAAPFIVQILFGDEFMETSPLLRIYVWSNIGTVAILLIQQYLVGENRAKQFLLLSVLGAITNTVLNMLLIPQFGTAGAAYATLMTLGLFVAAFVVLQTISSRHATQNRRL